jgi:hypothetical protein
LNDSLNPSIIFHHSEDGGSSGTKDEAEGDGNLAGRVLLNLHVSYRQT